MPKTATFTTITPLPSGITRKSVLDMYEDHMAMIDLNPLVVERFKCKPPSYAPTDEYFAAWYTIKDKVSYLPGGFATGSVSYHACFHDTPKGLLTHVYAPLGLDIRGKWTVGGSLPGEPKQPALKEKNIITPRHGLYIREDVTMTCSSLLMGFVKRTFKDSHASLVEKLVERAHLLESNFANQRLRALRTVEPGERMAIGDIFIAPPPDYLAPMAPDYRPWGYMSPYPESPSEPSVSPRFEGFSAPRPSPLHRTNTQTSHLSPRYSPPAHSNHSRSHSDPVTSPGFSSSSTLVSESDRPATPPKDNPLKIISQPSSSTLEPSLFLLPATTYNGGLSAHPVASKPGGSHARKESNLSLFPPRISYTPEERPISFTFTNESPFDTRSRTGSLANPNANLLDEIDDAIDQVFLYTVPSHSSAGNRSPSNNVVVKKVPQSAKEVLLPATTYGRARADTLPSTKHSVPTSRDTMTAIEADFSSQWSVQKISPKSSLNKTSSQSSLKKQTLPATKYGTSSADTLLLPSTKYEGDIAKTAPLLPATKYESTKTTLQATKYEPTTTLQATRYEPAPTLSSAKYDPEPKQITLPSTTYKPVERARKDSVVPWHEKELPPVPVDG